MPTRGTLAAVAALLVLPAVAGARDQRERSASGPALSAAGDRAAQARSAAIQILTGLPPEGDRLRGDCVNIRHCEHEAPARDPQDDPAGPRGGQAETSVAVDVTGRHVVIGFNDTRGFAVNPVSVSGVMVSHDGGRTFADKGQLPSPGDQPLGAQLFPQIYGDPEVKYLGGCSFVYASIGLFVKEYLPGAPTPVQGLSLHRSRDCGETWEGPFEITGATNPNGYIYSDGSAVDAADKEFLDVDPRTGRVLVSWTNFTHPALAPAGVQMSVAYSDDVLGAGAPTWSPQVIVSADATDGQASIPRFAADGSAYVAWRRFPSYYGNTTAVARSRDGGATWDAPVETSAEFLTMDQVLGNDRVNTSPSLVVDASRGRSRGNVYVVYVTNDGGDGGDVAFQRSTDGGQTWSSPLLLNSRPGADRPQWFPWITQDRASGRLFVFYYDQGVAPSGDLTQVSYTWSADSGKTWAAPSALSDRPFHAGWGNDTGQPNLGDYNQAVVQAGRLYASFAVAARPPLGFVDGQPSTGMTVPDVALAVVPSLTRPLGAPPLELAAVDAFDLGLAAGHNGFIDANESVGLRITLRNSSTNPLHAEEIDGAIGLLATSTPGVRIAQAVAVWPELAPGASAPSRSRFVLFTGPAFVAGTPIELTLTVWAEGSYTVLRHTLDTGTPAVTPLYAETFDAGPAGWRSVHGAGANAVPWTFPAAGPAAPGFCGAASGIAFHPNANDGPVAASGVQLNDRWERLIGPSIAVPADSGYVTVEFDVCTDTEDDPVLPGTAYDGVFLRLTDVTPGRTLRTVLAEAFEDQFTTGAAFHYPKHLPRSSLAGYFEDMSAWAGSSGGWRHVRLRLPGLAGSVFQLRFEFAQDRYGTCADVRPGHACGVAIDNVVVKSVKAG